MLSKLGYTSLDAFADDVVPSSIRIDKKTISNEAGMLPMSESEMLRRATELSEDNEVFRSFIGMGGCFTFPKGEWKKYMLTQGTILLLLFLLLL